MKPTFSNILCSLFTVIIVFATNGCMTSDKIINLAKGRTNEKIDISQIERGDVVQEWDTKNRAVYIIKHPKEKDCSLSPAPFLPLQYENNYFISKPAPLYYGLLPVTIPIDIVTFPIQLIFVLDWSIGGGSGY